MTNLYQPFGMVEVDRFDVLKKRWSNTNHDCLDKRVVEYLHDWLEQQNKE